MASVTSSPLSAMRPGESSISRRDGKLLHAVHIVELDALAHRPQRHRAVHRAGIDVGEAEPRRQALGDRALARARRAVDGDYDASVGSNPPRNQNNRGTRQGGSAYGTKRSLHGRFDPGRPL